EYYTNGRTDASSAPAFCVTSATRDTPRLPHARHLRAAGCRRRAAVNPHTSHTPPLTPVPHPGDGEVSERGVLPIRCGRTPQPLNRGDPGGAPVPGSGADRRVL